MQDQPDLNARILKATWFGRDLLVNIFLKILEEIVNKRFISVDTWNVKTACSNFSFCYVDAIYFSKSEAKSKFSSSKNVRRATSNLTGSSKQVQDGFYQRFFFSHSFHFFYKPVKISRIRKLTTWKINCPMRVQPLKRLSGLDAEHFDLSAEIWPGEFDISWEKNTNIQYLAFINVRIRVKVIWEPLSLIDIV